MRITIHRMVAPNWHVTTQVNWQLKCGTYSLQISGNW